MYEMTNSTRKPSEIKVGDRGRKDLGDLKTLAASLSAVGMLQPIGINEDNVLIFGKRRLSAAKQAKLQEVPVRVVHTKGDVLSQAQIEEIENTQRKSLNASEKTEIAKFIKSEISRRQGERTDIEKEEEAEEKDAKAADKGVKRPKKGQKTRDAVAEQAGFESSASMRAAEKVEEEGSKALKEAVNSEEIPLTVAAKIAKLPTPVQNKAVKNIVEKGMKPSEAIREAKPPVDEAGNEIPSNLRKVFTTGGENISQTLLKLGAVREEVHKIRNSKLIPDFPVDKVLGLLEDVFKLVDPQRVRFVCQQCAEPGQGCAKCKGRGYTAVETKEKSEAAA